MIFMPSIIINDSDYSVLTDRYCKGRTNIPCALPIQDTTRRSNKIKWILRKIHKKALTTHASQLTAKKAAYVLFVSHPKPHEKLTPDYDYFYHQPLHFELLLRKIFQKIKKTLLLTRLCQKYW